jgi:hypothetical protein
VPEPAHRTTQPVPRDAAALLKTGGTIMLVGALSAASIYLFFGGVTHQGPHTNAGWLALIVAAMCFPFGLMLFTLGAAKYFGHRRHHHP